MEADVEGMIGAGRYERSGERSTWRNGYRDRTLDTRLGQLNLRIPKLDTRKNSLIQLLFGARVAVATSICTAPGS
jgi:transposase-like protein